MNSTLLGFSLFFLACAIIWWFTKMCQQTKESFEGFNVPETDPTSLRVKNCVSVILGVDANELTSTTHFIKDLNVDSLDVVEIIMEIENEFEINIEDEDVEQLVTVGQLISYVAEADRLQNSQVENG